MAKISTEDKIHRMKMIRNLIYIKDMFHILIQINSIQTKILITIFLIIDLINLILLSVIFKEHS